VIVKNKDENSDYQGKGKVFGTGPDAGRQRNPFRKKLRKVGIIILGLGFEQ
jgi:hypothetical protein